MCSRYLWAMCREYVMLAGTYCQSLRQERTPFWPSPWPSSDFQGVTFLKDKGTLREPVPGSSFGNLARSIVRVHSEVGMGRIGKGNYKCLYETRCSHVSVIHRSRVDSTVELKMCLFPKGRQSTYLCVSEVSDDNSVQSREKTPRRRMQNSVQAGRPVWYKAMLSNRGEQLG